MAVVLNSSYSNPDEWLKADQTKPATSVNTMQSEGGSHRKDRGLARGAGRRAVRNERKPKNQDKT